MTAEQFAWAWLKSEFLYPKKLVFKSGSRSGSGNGFSSKKRGHGAGSWRLGCCGDRGTSLCNRHVLDGSITSGVEWQGTGELQWPLAHHFTITSSFGARLDPITGEKDFHTGIDISAPEGTPILAATDGVVTYANNSGSWGGSYGYYVRIQYDDGLETFYAHCLDICVKAGQEVEQGEVIGFVGRTGNTTGAHLHFEVRKEAE